MISMKNLIKKRISTASAKTDQWLWKDIVTEGKKSHFLKQIFGTVCNLQKFKHKI